MTRARGWILLTIVCVLAGAISGCGSVDPVGDAAAATAKASGARMAMRVVFSGGDGIPQDASMTATGVVDLSARRMRVNFDIGGLG